MNTTDIMKDPYYQPILFQIESRILNCAHAAESAGIPVNDSQIRSILNKVRKSSEGGKPQIPKASPRDQRLAELHDELLQIRAQMKEEGSELQVEGLTTREWTLCLRTVEESIQRHSTGPGSQAYLTFLEGFLPKGR